MTSTTTATRFTSWTFDEPCRREMSLTDLHPTNIKVLEYGNNNSNTNTNANTNADLILVGVAVPPPERNNDDEETETAMLVLEGQCKILDEEQTNNVLSEILVEEKESGFKGKVGSVSSACARVKVAGNTCRLILLGLGTVDGLDNSGAKIGEAVARKCVELKSVVNTCRVILPVATITSKFITDLTAAVYTTLYSDNRFRTGKKIVNPAENLTNIELVFEGSVDDADEAIATGRALALGVYMTKDIVNAPHNVLNSESMAQTAIKLAEESNGKIQVEILGKEECEKRGMGCYLGVARGSETDPQFVHMWYKPEGEVKQKVGVVGKGLLFDTGGYNIKVAMMEKMKFDCGGAAAVYGAARTIGQLCPAGVEVHFCVAAAENMINDKAYVPSDILQASNGMTVEVLNTDAEGRLTLADALVFADKEVGCDKIIELSTLTGACIVALGTGLAGIFTKNDKLANELADCSKSTGDKSWRMPMPDEYNKLLESKIADISNLGGRWGGSITAALFLQNFVDKKKPFAHIDIAGPVWEDSIGATGYGSKLVTEFVIRQGKGN